MPPRPFILTIIAFWLITTTWLIYREILPGLESSYPPPYSIDLADEVSAQTISWKFLQNNEELGTVQTSVRRQADRTFVLAAHFKPVHQWKILGIEIKELRSNYFVSRAGDLRKLTTKLILLIQGHVLVIQVKGEVNHGMFAPVVQVDASEAKDFPLPKLNPVAVPGHGNVLNPLHPLNRLRGLHAGQQWMEPMFDPLSVIVASLFKPVMTQLYAEVQPGLLPWDGTDVPCWKIEYRELGGNVVARTWVQREDGLVLKQEASHAGVNLVLQRGIVH